MVGTVDVVELGYQVETSQVLKGDAALDQLTVSTLNADNASKKLAQTSRGTGRAVQQSTQGVRGYGQAMRGASFNTANLAAQGNDVIVMLLAMQNPMQLALQQGTQVSQVLNQMGSRRQIIQGLGAAFTSMINPVSLATIGIIAGGAALAQMALRAVGAGEKAESFSDRMERLSDAVKAYDTAAVNATTTTSEMEERFGGATIQLRGTLDLLNQIAKNNAQRVLNETAEAIANIGGGIRTVDGFESDFGVILTLDSKVKAARRRLNNESEGLVRDFKALQAELLSSDGDTEAQVVSLQKLQQVAVALADVNGRRTEEEDENLKIISDALIKAREKLAVDRESSAERAKALADARELSDIERELGAGIAQAVQARMEAGEEASKVLSTLQNQVALNAVIAQFGEDSVAVTRLRAQQERAIFVEQTNTRNISQELKNELIAAYDAANRLAQTDTASGLNSAAEAAERIAERLGVSLELAQKIAAAGAGPTNNNGLDSLDPRNPNNARPIFEGETGTVSPFDASRNRLGSPAVSASGGGGGVSDDYESNLNSLVQSLETERETLESWYSESQTLLEDRRVLEFLTEQEHKEALLALDRDYYAQQADIARNAAQVEVEARATALNSISGLLGTFAGESRAAAIAQIAINKGLSIAQAIQNTAVAQTRALAELGPVLGPPAAARIGAFGKLQIAAIAATGLAQAGSVGGGGAGGGGGGGASGTSATATSESLEPKRVLLEFPNAPEWVKGMFEDFTTAIQEGSRDGVVYEVAR